jgi:hypothetical protein
MRAFRPSLMRSKFTHLIMLTAWLFATGVQWDLVQVAAWARMFANNARVLPWRDALELTFSPDGMCHACHAVREAKQDDSENASSVVTNAAKEPLVFQSPVEMIVAAPDGRPWILIESALVAHDRARPATPPPRFVG